MSKEESESGLLLKNFRPQVRIDPLMRPVHRFMEIEASGGIVLLLAIILALFMANTSLATWYDGIWDNPLAIQLGQLSMDMSFRQMINEGLMTIFFFVLGLEIKREIIHGELRSMDRAVFPLVAALGGLLIPAGLYWIVQRNGPGTSGWAIPMGTDVAFLIGFLSLLGRRVPYQLKITLLAVVIADNLGATVLSALLYAPIFSREYFLAGLGFYLLVFILQFLGVRRILPYLLLALPMWYCIDRSGVHPTIAGVLLGLATPGVRLIKGELLKNFLGLFQHRLERETPESPVDRELLRQVGRESLSPLERLGTDFHPWLAFLILPLFALANVGISVEASALESSLTWAVALGLVIGKPLGLFGLVWLAHKAKLIAYPSGVSPRVFFAATCLCGVGFTMSIFISDVAFQGEGAAIAKTGVLIGSAFSALIGLFLLHKALPRRELEEHTLGQ